MGFSKQKNTAIVNGDPADGFFAEKTRLNDIANAWRFMWVAGSRKGLIEGTGVQDCDEYIDFRIDLTVGAAGYTGYVFKVIVEARTDNAGTSITPKVYNVDTNSEVTVTGAAAITSTTWTRQILTLDQSTMTAGVAYYRVRCSKNNATNNVQMIAYLEITAA